MLHGDQKQVHIIKGFLPSANLNNFLYRAVNIRRVCFVVKKGKYWIFKLFNYHVHFTMTLIKLTISSTRREIRKVIFY